MRQFPGAQAAWLVGVTAGGAASSAGVTVAAGDDTTAAVRLDLTGATARRGALRRTAARGGVAARGGARRRAVRLRAARCAAAARLRLRSRSALGTAPGRRAFLLLPGPGAVLLGSAYPLPDLAGCRGMLACALGFALGLFQAFARALQLFLRDAHALLGDFRLQPCSLERLGRGVLFAACLLHRWARDAKGAQSHTSRSRLPPWRTYPHNLCITMWTDAARVRKRSAQARGCVMMNGFSPTWLAVRGPTTRCKMRGRYMIG